MDGASNTNHGRRLPMIGHRLLHPRARAESPEAGVQARAVNLVVCGHQKARAASQELVAIMVKESPLVLFCHML